MKKYNIGDLLIWEGHPNLYAVILEELKDVDDTSLLYRVYHSSYGITLYPIWMLEFNTLTGMEFINKYG
jgi:hypothetical protein